MFLKKIALTILTVSTALYGTVSRADVLPSASARQTIFQYAHQGDIKNLNHLKNMGYDLDVTDRKGNTALCSAVIVKDVLAYNTLIRAGANVNHSCMDEVSTDQKKSFCSGSGLVDRSICTGFSPDGLITSSLWMDLGGVAILGAAGVAAASGGGGGGGGGGKSHECSGHGSKDDSGKCVCKDGWSGTNCEIDDLCIGIDCSGHGTCSRGVCTCKSGYEGDNCEIDILCEGIDCNGNGTCSQGVCSCNPGYSGEDCAIADKCYKVNCGQHGSCDVDTGKCVCTDDYTGTNCEKAPPTTVKTVTTMDVDSDSLCAAGDYINGMCMADRLSDDGSTPVSSGSAEAKATDDVRYVAEYGGNVTNDAEISDTGNESAQQVGMWANGVAKAALSDGESSLNLKKASKATNNATLTLAEESASDKGVVGMRATSGGTAENTGTINIIAQSASPSAAIDAGRINDGIPNRGANIETEGTINLDVSGQALDVKGIYAPDRTVLAHTSSEMNILVGENGWGSGDSNKRGMVTGMSGKTVVNRGAMTLKAKDFSAATVADTAQVDVKMLEASDGGAAYNDGTMDIDLTNLRYNIFGIYPTAGTKGAKAVNNGTMTVTGTLENDPNIANHIYLLGSGSGAKSTLLNEGDISVDIDATNGGILHVMDELSGTATNNRNITINIDNTKNPTEAVKNTFEIAAISMTGGTMTNNGRIEANLVGETSSDSTFAALDAYGAANPTQTNNGEIIITSDIDNSKISAFRSRGKKTNGSKGKIEITSTADNTEILTNGNPASGTGTGTGSNGGTIIINKNGGSGAIQAWSGGNNGNIYVNADNMGPSSRKIKGTFDPFIVGVGVAGGGSSAGDSDGLVDIRLTGTTYGQVQAYSAAGTLSLGNKVLVSALNSERIGDLDIYGFYHTPDDAGNRNLTRTGETTINVAGSKDYATNITGLYGKNTNITHTDAGVLNINANLGESTSHSIIGMESVEEPDKKEGIYIGNKTCAAINNGTISITADGKHNTDNPDTPDINESLNVDVIGILTNSYAENNGKIEITVSGGLHAIGMKAYDGGRIVNTNSITFNLNGATTFTPFYADGSRDVMLEFGYDPKDSDKKYVKKFETLYASVYNSGSIIVNQSPLVDDVGSGNYYYGESVGSGNWARREYTLQDFNDDDPEKEDYFLLTKDTTVKKGTKEDLDWHSTGAEDEPEYPTEFDGTGENSPGYENTMPGYQKIFEISKTVKYESAKKGVLSAAGMHMTGNVTADYTLAEGGNLDFYLGDGLGEGALISDGNYDDLTVESGSALFTASYQQNQVNPNGIDIAMTRRPFQDVLGNTNLARYLERNYTAGNNEAFFNQLKSFGDTRGLTDSLDKLTGRDMLSRFNFEDMTMMRELNFDMNEKLFHNKDKAFALAGSVSPMAFHGDTGSDARYSLYNKREGKWSVGLGIAFTDIRSDNAHDDDDRRDTMYQLIVPVGYRTHGFNLMISPRIGYARGSYDRTGFDDKNYDGTIEKRVFGLMNEARYPLAFGDWTLEPAAEFNILGYTQRGHEDKKDYALNIKSQNTYSVETGVGLYMTKAKELTKTSQIKLTAGVAAYHEFADPYKLRVGMEGMDGSFTLRDEKRSDNRGVIRAGFDYDWDDYSLYGSFMSYIDKEVRSTLKTGFKWKF